MNSRTRCKMLEKILNIGTYIVYACESNEGASSLRLQIIYIWCVSRIHIIYQILFLLFSLWQKSAMYLRHIIYHCIRNSITRVIKMYIHIRTVPTVRSTTFYLCAFTSMRACVRACVVRRSDVITCKKMSGKNINYSDAQRITD